MGNSAAQSRETSGSKGWRLILQLKQHFRVLRVFVAGVFAPAVGPGREFQQTAAAFKLSDVEERRDAVMRLGSMRLAAASRAALPALQDAAPIVRATAAKAILVDWQLKRALVISCRYSMTKTNLFVAKQLTRSGMTSSRSCDCRVKRTIVE